MAGDCFSSSDIGWPIPPAAPRTATFCWCCKWQIKVNTHYRSRQEYHVSFVLLQLYGYARIDLHQCAMLKLLRRITHTWEATEKLLIVLLAPCKRNEVLESILKGLFSAESFEIFVIDARFWRRDCSKQYACLSFQALAVFSVEQKWNEKRKGNCTSNYDFLISLTQRRKAESFVLILFFFFTCLPPKRNSHQRSDTFASMNFDTVVSVPVN